MPTSPPFIALHSEEIQDILGKAPTYLVRWGITVIFFVLMVIFLISWFVKYPDIIKGNITITSLNPSVRLISKVSGRAIFLVTDKKEVLAGEKIAYLENSAKFEDILALEKILSDFSAFSQTKPQNLSLGELQTPFEVFQNAIQETFIFQNTNPTYQQIQSLKIQIETLEKINKNALQQQQILENELSIAEKQYKREQFLYEQKVNPALEQEKSEAIIWQQRRNFKNYEGTILANELRIGELHSRIAELSLQISEKEEKLNLNLQTALQNLKSQYEVWKKRYILESPISGKATFLKYWSSNQYVQAEQEIVAIIPVSQQNIGKIEIPLERSGKVEKGQKVNIKLFNFPSEEFGLLEGEILDVSFLLQNDSKGEKKYIITVVFPKNMKTSFNKMLPATAELQGEANIITKDLRLLERSFQGFLK